MVYAPKQLFSRSWLPMLHSWPIIICPDYKAHNHNATHLGWWHAHHKKQLKCNYITNWWTRSSLPNERFGPINFFLGIEPHWSGNELYLVQTKYIVELLQKTKMDGAKPLSSPVAAGSKLSKYLGDPVFDPSLYRSIVGALQYVTLTRLDISFVVNQVCQFMHAPTVTHWIAIKRIMHYLKGTLDHGLHYKSRPITLIAFSDADYVKDLDDRRYTSVGRKRSCGKKIEWEEGGVHEWEERKIAQKVGVCREQGEM